MILKLESNSAQGMVDNLNNVDPDEISLKEVILKVRVGWRYLLSRWAIILVAAVIGGLLGLAYSFIKKPVYTATSTFVIEDNKSGGMSQYAGLASLAGIDLGGSSNGIFQGDNIIELYKSRAMIEKALLSPITIKGKKKLLIDRYIEFNYLRESWKKNDHINEISFHGDPDKFGRKQDSIITDLVDLFNKKVLNVEKPDKKLSIIKVDVSNTDELFSKAFNDKLVKTVNDFYVQTKTKKSYQNVLILQKQADSVRKVLNGSISGVAAAIDAAPNANPNQSILRVPSQRKQVDVQASTAIYSEIVKNLEVSRMSLLQETPLIQLIDEPVLPLSVNRLGKLKGIVFGGVLAGMLAVFILALKKIFKNVMK